MQLLFVPVFKDFQTQLIHRQHLNCSRLPDMELFLVWFLSDRSCRHIIFHDMVIVFSNILIRVATWVQFKTYFLNVILKNKIKKLYVSV